MSKCWLLFMLQEDEVQCAVRVCEMADSAGPGLASAPSPANNLTRGRPEDAILFVGVSLILGVICRQLLKGTRVPYTVALLLLGVGLGAVEYGTKSGLGTLGASIRLWSTINPELILFIFLPALLFESSFAMEVHQIKRCIMQMVLLAGPGVLISTACLAIVNRFLFPYGWNWSTCLLLGGLLSATDPVAVVALLKELGASKKLSTIVEGESLMNDGTAIVVYKLFFQMVLGQHFSAGDIVKFFARVSLGAVALGIGFGLLAAAWIGCVFNDTIIEITMTLTASYLAFFVAEDEAEVSGVLTVMTVGIFFAAFARTAFTGENQQSMHHFWEMISYIANTLIFILSGTVIAESILRSGDNIEGHDWGYLLLLYLFLQLSRAVVVIVLYPGLRFFGYGLDWKEAVVLIWAGLRGAVALSLSLSVSQAGDSEMEGYTPISKQTEARFVFFTGGIVLLTLIVNGTTTQFLLTLLRMNITSETKGLILEYVRHQMYSKVLDSFGELGEDEDLGPADWPTLCKYVTCLGELTSPRILEHPHGRSITEEQQRALALQDTRIRFLNVVQAAYWGMLEEGRISRTAALLLMRSVDEALDLVARGEHLHDWNAVRPHVTFPKYLKWRSSTMLPQRVLTFFTVDRLELGCCIVAAFLRAHRQAERQIQSFIGESEIADAVIRESQDAGKEARDFLEDIRMSFPQVLQSIKTKQVTRAILVNLCTYVSSLEEAGLLETKETNHLHDSLQVDLKKLHRDPPSALMPSAREALSNQPFFGALPAHMQGVLSSSAKEVMMERDSTLYTEDARPECVWLIANGNVKWNSKKYDNRQTLHPILSHGTTLGLYEALTGKPLLCSVTADSLAHCFCLENSTLMSTLQVKPELEEFFWQESALLLAKVIMPQHFEAFSMHDLRCLITEGSVIRTYIAGETIELETSKVGILLEGFVKQEGRDDIMSAPAGLLSALPESQPRRGSRSSIPVTRSVYYHVEARSRVLFLNIQPRLATPRTSMSTLIPLHLSRERDSLMRFPSKYRNSAGQLTDATSKTSSTSEDALERHSSSYSARAMVLSLFGTKFSSRNKNVGSGPSGSTHVLSGMHNFHTQRSGPSGSTPILSGPNNFRTQRRVQSEGNMPQFGTLQPRVMNLNGYSSADSDSEEDHIVEIASPSRLFHIN